jgi:hypothetical protein
MNSNYTNYGIMSNITVSTNTHLKGIVTISDKIQNLSIINNYTDYGIMSNITVSGLTKIKKVEATDNNITFFETKKPISATLNFQRDTECNLNIYGTTRFFDTVHFDNKIWYNPDQNAMVDTTLIQFSEIFLFKGVKLAEARFKNYFTVKNIATDVVDINLGQGLLKSKDIITCNLTVLTELIVPRLNITNTVEFTSTESTFKKPIIVENTELSIQSESSIVLNGNAEIKSTLLTNIDDREVNLATKFLLNKNQLGIDKIQASTIWTNLLYTNNIRTTGNSIFITESSASLMNESVFYITNAKNESKFDTIYANVDYILRFYVTEEHIIIGGNGEFIVNETLINEDNISFNSSNKTFFGAGSADDLAKQLTTNDYNTTTNTEGVLFADHYLVYENGYDYIKKSYRLEKDKSFKLYNNPTNKKYEILLIFKIENNTTEDDGNLNLFTYHNFELKYNPYTEILYFNNILLNKIIENQWNMLYIQQTINDNSISEFIIILNGINIGKYNITQEPQDEYIYNLYRSQKFHLKIDSLFITNNATAVFFQDNKIYKYLPLIQTIDGFGFAETLGFNSSNGSNALSADTTTNNVFLEINHGYIQTYNPLFVGIERNDFIYEGYGSLIVNTPPTEKDYFLSNNPVGIFTKILYTTSVSDESYPVMVLCSKKHNTSIENGAQKVSFDISKWKSFNTGNTSYTQLNINLSGQTFLASSDVMSIRSKTSADAGCVGINNTNPTSNLDIVGNVRINGDLNVTTIAGNGANLTNLTMANISTTITVEKGGTGRTSFTENKLLMGNGTNGITSNSEVSFTDNTLNAPNFTGNLAVDNITGTLPVNKGGTGRTTFAANKLLMGNEANGITSNSAVYVSTDGILSAPKFAGNGNALTDLNPDEIELSLNSVTNSFNLLTSAGTVTLGGTSTYIRSTLTIQIGNNASEATGNGNFTTNLFLNAANTHINSSGTIKIGNKFAESTQTNILELNGDTINITSSLNSFINIDGMLKVKNTIQSTENIFNIGTLSQILNIGGSQSDINIGVSGTTSSEKTVTIGGDATIRGDLNVMGATAFENLSFTHLTVTSNLTVGANATINEGLLLNNGVFLSGNRVPYIKVLSVTSQTADGIISSVGTVFYGQIFNYNRHIDNNINMSWEFDDITQLYNSRKNSISATEIYTRFNGLDGKYLSPVFNDPDTIYNVIGAKIDDLRRITDWKVGDTLYIFNTEITQFIDADKENYHESLLASGVSDLLLLPEDIRIANNMENELLIGGNIRLMYGKLKLINSINFQNEDSINFEHDDNTVCFTINANGALDVYSNIDFTHQDHLDFTSNLEIRCRITSNQFHVAGDIIAFKTEMTSDSNLKTNIHDLEYDTTILSSLRPVTFEWKDDIFNVHKRGKHEIGLIAQEVEEVIPEIVSLTKMIDGNEYKTINYNSLIPFLIQSLQDAHKKINELEMRIKKLEI